MSSRLLLGLLLFLAGSQAAFAQIPPGGLSQIPTGLRQGAAGRGDVATLTLDAMSIADANNEPDGSLAGDALHQGVQVSSALMARFTYRALEAKRLKLQFGAQTGARHYLDLHQFTGIGHNAQLSALVPLGRSSLSVTESLSYTPNYSLIPAAMFVPEDSVPVSAAEVDYSVARNPTVSSNTNIGLTLAMGGRSGLVMSYGLRRTQFMDETGSDLTEQGAGARFGHRLTKFLSFHAGYARRLGSFGPVSTDVFSTSPVVFTGSPGVFATAPDVFVDDVDLGLDFNNNRTIKLGRKTTFAFGTGSSIVSQAERRQFMLTGNVTLARQLGRTGSASVSYDRGVQMIDGLRAPVFADSIRGSVTASFGPRVSLTNGVSYTFGAVGLGSADNDYRATGGWSEVNIGVTRRAAFYVGYTFTGNSLGSSVELPANVPSVYHRQSARVGLSVRVPVIERQPSRERN